MNLLQIMLSHPSVMLRLGFEFLRFRKEARKGSNIFREELIRRGISEARATELADFYYKVLRIF